MIEDAQNKMMTDAPAKKEYHFAATLEHYAEVVYAATVEEAEQLYHKIKRPIAPDTPAAPSPTPPAPIATEQAAPLSTSEPAPKEEGIE